MPHFGAPESNSESTPQLDPLAALNLPEPTSKENIQQIIEAFNTLYGRNDATTRDALDYISCHPGITVEKPVEEETSYIGKTSHVHAQVFFDGQRIYETYYDPLQVYRRDLRRHGPEVPLMAGEEMNLVARAFLTPENLARLGWEDKA